MSDIKCFSCGEVGRYYHYVPSKLYCFSCYDKLTKERDQLRAENERLREGLDKVIQTTDKYEVDKNDSNDYWDWTDNGIDIIVEIEDIAKKVLKEVKE